MNEEEFTTKWQQEKPLFASWGLYARGRILELIGSRVDVDVREFVKICPPPRLKGDQTLLDKAFHRGKGYSDPYSDITDKVALRFVVLLQEDVDLVSELIEGCADWTSHKDQDPSTRWAAKPAEFGYVSVHYILEASREISFEGQTIPLGTPCEVQIRTLVQHAYCELTHDSVYKPKLRSTPQVLRAIAKSMALIEATDDYFTTAIGELRSAAKPQQQALISLADSYRSKLGRDPSYDQVNLLLIDAYSDIMQTDLTARVNEFFEAHANLTEQIRERARRSHLFRQPAMLLVYALVAEDPRAAKSAWPLEDESLRPVFVDLGLSFDQL